MQANTPPDHKRMWVVNIKSGGGYCEMMFFSSRFVTMTLILSLTDFTLDATVPIIRQYMHSKDNIATL